MSQSRPGFWASRIPAWIIARMRVVVTPKRRATSPVVMGVILLRMRKLAMIGVMVLLVMVFGAPMLSTSAGIAGNFVDTATTVLLNVAPKIAVGSFLVGLVLLTNHWTRKHAVTWIVGSVICLIGAAAVSVVSNWTTVETQSVATSATSIATAMISRILGGLTAGVG